MRPSVYCHCYNRIYVLDYILIIIEQHRLPPQPTPHPPLTRQPPLRPPKPHPIQPTERPLDDRRLTCQKRLHGVTSACETGIVFKLHSTTGWSRRASFPPLVAATPRWGDLRNLCTNPRPRTSPVEVREPRASCRRCQVVGFSAECRTIHPFESLRVGSVESNVTVSIAEVFAREARGRPRHRVWSRLRQCGDQVVCQQGAHWWL